MSTVDFTAEAVNCNPEETSAKVETFLANHRWIHSPHYAEWKRSGISDEVILANRLHSVPASEIFTDGRATTLGMCQVYEYYNLDGTAQIGVQWKPDNPRFKHGKDGEKKVVKYENPAGLPTNPFFPAHAEDKFRDRLEPMLFTEGVKKGLAIRSHPDLLPVPISLVGVFNFSNPAKDGLNSHIANLPMKGRAVYIAYDSDAATNKNVRLAESRLAKELIGRGAKVMIVRIPTGPNGEKQGADDFIVAHGPEAFADLLKMTERSYGPKQQKELDLKSPWAQKSAKQRAKAERRLDAQWEADKKQQFEDNQKQEAEWAARQERKERDRAEAQATRDAKPQRLTGHANGDEVGGEWEDGKLIPNELFGLQKDERAALIAEMLKSKHGRKIKDLLELELPQCSNPLWRAALQNISSPGRIIKGDLPCGSCLNCKMLQKQEQAKVLMDHFMSCNQTDFFYTYADDARKEELSQQVFRSDGRVSFILTGRSKEGRHWLAVGVGCKIKSAKTVTLTEVLERALVAIAELDLTILEGKERWITNCRSWPKYANYEMDFPTMQAAPPVGFESKFDRKAVELMKKELQAGNLRFPITVKNKDVEFPVRDEDGVVVGSKVSRGQQVVSGKLEWLAALELGWDFIPANAEKIKNWNRIKNEATVEEFEFEAKRLEIPYETLESGPLQGSLHLNCPPDEVEEFLRRTEMLYLVRTYSPAKPEKRRNCSSSNNSEVDQFRRNGVSGSAGGGSH